MDAGSRPAGEMEYNLAPLVASGGYGQLHWLRALIVDYLLQYGQCRLQRAGAVAYAVFNLG